MSSQQRAFNPGPALGGLSDRQTLLLTHLQHNPAGLRAIDLGGFLHMRKANPCPYCSDTSTCQYASRDANAALESLRKRRLATRRRDGKWYALVGVEDGRTDPRTNPFPEGF